MLEFLVTFALLLPMGFFVGMILTTDIKKKIFRVIAVLIVICIIAGGLSAIIVHEHQSDLIAWNDGFCSECAGKYHLVSVEKRKCYYTCEDCGKVIVLNELHQ